MTLSLAQPMTLRLGRHRPEGPPQESTPLLTEGDVEIETEASVAIETDVP